MLALLLTGLILQTPLAQASERSLNYRIKIGAEWISSQKVLSSRIKGFATIDRLNKIYVEENCLVAITLALYHKT
ncbi:TPA: hypothetical protein EYP26_06205, partial [Candidatus Bathyarchaeota archaeon]|nr:hypothetical protein [Candidatus Bathyarchaeota archaeon]